MIVTAGIEYVTGKIKYGHYEVYIPDDAIEVFKQMSREEQIEYIEDNGDILIDNFEIGDYGDITEINYNNETNN